VIPDTAEKEKPMKGKVLAIGPGKLNEKGEANSDVGQGRRTRVLFKNMAPTKLKLTGKNTWSGRKKIILAIIE